MFHGKGLILDKENKKYKKYVSVLFFKVGDWKPLPNFTFIALTKAKASRRLNSARTMGNSVTLYDEVFCVYLCIDAGRKILVCKSKNKEEAMNLGKGAADYLGIPLKDFVKKV